MLQNLRLKIVISLFALTIAASKCAAHDLSLSGIRVVYRSSDAVVSVTTHISRLLRADGNAPDAVVDSKKLGDELEKRLHLRFDGKPFLTSKPYVIADKANDLLVWQTVVSPAPFGKLEILSRLYPEDKSSRTVVSIVRNGQSVEEVLLDADHPAILRGQAQNDSLKLASRFFEQGIEHILSGADHILFVFGLILLGGSLRSLLTIITAFTLAHSITLSLAATGVFVPSPRIVEPAIALSIVAIAIENLRELKQPKLLTETGANIKPHRDIRVYFAALFGLVHGFGFASALAEVGLPKEDLVLALAMFNVGVECGQACIILLLSPVLAWFSATSKEFYKRFVLACAILIAGVGSYWFVTRIF